MATFRDIDLEHLSDVLKNRYDKANTLGADGSPSEEPFPLSPLSFAEDIMLQKPDVDDLDTPSYGDQGSGGGSIGTRWVKVRLHPLVVSGKSGNSSIQTFMAVSASPRSDSSDDIEEVRIKRLIPPSFSIGRGTAHESDITKRGFDLALFPAKQVGDSLEADDSRGPISQLADPSATYGAGDSGSWSVDYDSGIIRFSTAPLNGSTGIMNPNDVYGAIDGKTADGNQNGRITMFATFYQYVGASFDGYGEAELVVVGDGVNSLGRFNSETEAGIFDAVLNLSAGGNGGSIFIKAGNYTFGTSVTIPANVKLIGTSRYARITKPDGEPAFIMEGNNSSIEGLSIFASGSSSDDRAAIEIITTENTGVVGGLRTLEDIYVKNNILYSTSDAYGIGIASGHTDAVFKNILIEDNHFICAYDDSDDSSIHIGEVDSGLNNASVHNLKINRNVFDGDVREKSISVLLDGNCFDRVNEVYITDGYSEDLSDIIINNSIGCDQVTISNNKNFNDIIISTTSLSNLNMKGNICDSISISSSNNSAIDVSDNTSDYLYLHGTVDHSTVSNNHVLNSSTLTGNFNYSSFAHNKIDGYAAFGDVAVQSTISNNLFGNTATFEGLLSDSLVVGNEFDGYGISLEIKGAVSRSLVNSNRMSMHPHYSAKFSSTVSDLIFSDNICGGFVSIDDQASNVNMSGNKIRESVEFDFDGYNDKIIISNNIIDGSISGVPEVKISQFNIENNIVGSAVHFSEVYEGNISGNHISDIDFGTTHNVVIDNNKITDLLFSGKVYNLTLSNNIVLGTFTANQSVGIYEYLTISDNDFVGDVVFSNQNVQFSKIIGNVFRTHLTITPIDYVYMHNNNMSGATAIDGVNHSKINDNAIFGLAIHTSRLLSSELSNNTINELTISQNSGTNNDLMISNNIFTGAVSVTNQNITNSVICGNAFRSTIDFTGFDNNEFVNNTVDGSAQLNIIEDSRFNGNIMNDVTIHGVLLRSSFADNTIGGTFSSTQIGSANTNLTITGNRFASTTTFADIIQNSSIVGNIFVDQITFDDLSQTSFSNNVILGSTSMTVNDLQYSNVAYNVFLGTVAITPSGSNYVDYTAISNNYFNSTFDCDSASNNGLRYSSFNENIAIGDIELGECSSSNIDGNCLYNDSAAIMSIYRLISSSFNNNTCSAPTGPSYIDIENYVSWSNISGNTLGVGVVGLDIGTYVEYSNISGNIINGNIVVGTTISESLICSNVIDNGITTTSEITGTSITGNYLENDITVGAHIGNVIISENVLSGADITITDDMDGSIISGNYINGITVSSSAGDSTGNIISNNRIDTGGIDFSALSTGEVNTSVFSNNYSAGLFDFGSAVDDCEFSNNYVAGITVDGILRDTVVSGNNFTANVTLDNIYNVSWTGNRHATQFIVLCGSAATVAATEFVFSGNLCVGSFSINHDVAQIASATSSLTDCVINNNVFSSTMSIGYNTSDQHTWDRVMFNNNSGSGIWAFNSSDDDNINEIMIIGNNINGGLNFQLGSGGIESPAQSEDTHIIAMNFFSSYTGFTFDNDKALGWGDTASSSTVETTPTMK